MSGTVPMPKKSTVKREAYLLDFAEKLRSLVKVPLMVTGGFRSFDGMNTALQSGALDIIGLARLMAIAPDSARSLFQGSEPNQAVKPISTGIRSVDRMGIMEILWYSRQLRRIADGDNPRERFVGILDVGDE